MITSFRATPSYIRSASCAMCSACPNWVFWSSIFASSFKAPFSIAFIPVLFSVVGFWASSSFCRAVARPSWAPSSSPSTSWVPGFGEAASARPAPRPSSPLPPAGARPPPLCQRPQNLGVALRRLHGAHPAPARSQLPASSAWLCSWCSYSCTCSPDL